MSIATKTDGNIHTITIPGRLDFNFQNDFRVAYESAGAGSEFILDFTATEYIDSSALGMLLLLRDYAGGDSAKIELKNCHSEVKTILDIANFQKLFAIQ